MTARVEVLEVRLVTGHGNLRGFVKVRLGCVVIHGCRVIQQPDQRPWVALPQVPARKKADGTGAGWFPCVEITNRAVLDQLREAVLAAWATHQERPPLPVRGQATWDAARDRVQELAADFDRRPPDEVPF